MDTVEERGENLMLAYNAQLSKYPFVDEQSI